MNFMYIMHGFFILQTSIQSYLKNLLYQPRQLLSAFQQLDQQQFQTAMKYLFNSRKDYLVSLCMRNRAALKGLGKGKRTRLGILPCMLGCYLAGLEQIAGAPFSRLGLKVGCQPQLWIFCLLTGERCISREQLTFLHRFCGVGRTTCSLWVSVCLHWLERGRMTGEGEINDPVKVPCKQIIRQFGGEAAWCFSCLCAALSGWPALYVSLKSGECHSVGVASTCLGLYPGAWQHFTSSLRASSMGITAE